MKHFVAAAVLAGATLAPSAGFDRPPIASADQAPARSGRGWPAVTRETKPWTRWWWHGSAVRRESLTQQLETFRQAGLGGGDGVFTAAAWAPLESGLIGPVTPTPAIVTQGRER